MRVPYDQLAKRILEAAFARVPGFSAREFETHAEPLRIDFVHAPTGARQPGLVPGLLDRLAWEPVLVEFFQDAPTERDVRRCLVKQAAFEDHLERTGSFGVPRIWLICARHPAAILRAFRLAQRGPAGFYTSGQRGLRLSVASVPELDATRDTLLLRLLGRGQVLAEAVRGIRALPADEPERKIALPALKWLRLALPEARLGDAEDEEVRMAIEETYEQIVAGFEARGEARGAALARLQTLVEAVLTSLDAHGLTVSSAERERILACPDTEQLTAWLRRIAKARSTAEVLSTAG